MDKNVLVWPGSTELGYEICESLNPLRFYKIITASSKNVSIEQKISDVHCVLPDVSSPHILSELQQLIKTYNIDIIYPAHDDIIVFCSQHSHALQEVTIISPDDKTAQILRSKHKTIHALDGQVPTPKVFINCEDVYEYPVFAKPDIGQGSQGIKLITTAAELDLSVSENPAFFKDYVVSEFLPGTEYTVDCLSDGSATLVFCAARERLQIRNGISTDAQIVDNPEIKALAALINQRFLFKGAWFFQVKASRDGILKLLEIAPRLGGASCLNRMRGVNFAHLSILAQEGQKFTLLTQNIPNRIQRRLANFPVETFTDLAAIYVDFDDCLVIKDKLNTKLLEKLFKHQNQGTRLVLVSRHAGDLHAVLTYLRIHPLFDRIIHISDPAVTKSSAIEQDIAQHMPQGAQNCIFIDDSYKERLDVGTSLGLPAIDLTMLEVL